MSSFTPTCAMCVADCDGSSILTNCQHFLCARCFAKYPKGHCPRCQKPCKSIALSDPNVPRDMMCRLKFEVAKNLTMALQSLDLQQRLDRQANLRLKELSSQMHQQLRNAMQQLSECQRKLHSKTEEAKRLEVESDVLRRQLREYHEAGRLAVAQQHQPMMQQQQQQQPMPPSSRSTPAMPLPPSSSSQHHMDPRSPSGFRPDAFSSNYSTRESVSIPPLSPFGHMNTSRLADVSVPPSPSQAPPIRPPLQWSPASSAAVTPLGWSRNETSGVKRDRDESAHPPHERGMSTQFRVTTNAQQQPPMKPAPQSQTQSQHAASMRPHSTNPAGSSMNMNTQPNKHASTLPTLRSLMPSTAATTARLVRSSSGHDFP